MPFDRLPETVQTLYAELLDQLRVAEGEAAIGALRGTFVAKQIRGRTYWYLQKSEGATKRQIYIGAESPALLERMRHAEQQRTDFASDEKHRRELVAMIAAGGMFRESAAIGTVLATLSAADVFRAGGVLVGTQAFICLANMLGVSFEQTTMRTADIDVAHDGTIPVGLQSRTEDDMLAALRTSDPRFVAVPGFDSREQSTSFKVRGRDLRVDFLTPASSRSNRKIVLLPHLGIAAQPLAGLDYLIGDTVDAAAIAGSGVLVNVPAPGRFALHKLWVAAERPVSESAKAKKDMRQATQMLELLIQDRPEEITKAYAALTSRRSMLRRVRAQLKLIDADVLRHITPYLEP